MAHFITQQDADFFFEMGKFPEEEKEYQFPSSGQKLTITFTSSDKRENFLFDIYRGSIKITKITYQNRVRKAFILRRLDLDGPTHVNPEAKVVPFSILEPYITERKYLHLIYIFMLKVMERNGQYLQIC